MDLTKEYLMNYLCHGPQRVIQAAYQMRDDQVITLPRPLRHNNLCKMFFLEGKYEGPMRVGDRAGFILSNGKFVGRKLALAHMETSGQIPLNAKRISTMLTSEDVYDINGYCIWPSVDDKFAIRPEQKTAEEYEVMLFKGKDPLLAATLKNFRCRAINLTEHSNGQEKSPLLQIYRSQISEIEKAFSSFGFKHDRESLDAILEKEPEAAFYVAPGILQRSKYAHLL